MRPESFAYDGIVNCSKTEGYLLHDSRVLLDGSKRPHMERLESRCLSMDAWNATSYSHSLVRTRQAQSAGSWVSYLEGRVEMDSPEDEFYCGLVAWETLECGGGSWTLRCFPN